jgi:hypothetical protein
MPASTATNKVSALVNQYVPLPDGSPIDGTFTLNGATPVTVTDPNLTSGHSILMTLVTVGGTVGAAPSVKTRTNGTGFTVAGTASDTSVFSYKLI